ncbi:MAG TPA: undecaprenyl-diphosphate phosphatase [Firmicutes bacterium]|nr:undecaprenyl-diphosphate phosphatase [Bacillota bacterium]
MSWVWAILLGAIQGLTEFLPVSSSGHLVILQGLAGIKAPGVTFEVALHLGTLLAVVVVLWSDIRAIWDDLVYGGTQAPGRLGRPRRRQRSGRRLLVMLLVACLPTGAIGVLGKDALERLFSSPAAAAWALVGTGLVLMASPLLLRGRTPMSRVKVGQALLVGTAQGLAIIPGLSRSGITITAGLAAGLEPDAAARFSFLLSIPAILGAAAVDVFDLRRQAGASLSGWLAAAGLSPVSLLLGVGTATVVGIVSVRWMLGLVRRGQLRPFAYYCFLIAALTLAITYLR